MTGERELDLTAPVFEPPHSDRAKAAGLARSQRFSSQTVRLTTSDGICLAGRWAKCSEPTKGSVVLVHGFSASQDHADVLALAETLGDLSYDVLTYDARGHGSSEGLSGVGSAEHLDVACAVAEATALGRPVALVGVSMGAVATVGYLASERPLPQELLGAVVVSSPSRWRMRPSALGLLTAGLTRTSLGRFVAQRKLGVRIARRWRVGQAPEELVKKVELPLAIVHGVGDRLLSWSHAKRLHASATSPCRLDLVHGMGHGLDQAGRAATTDAVEWVMSYSPAAPTTTQGR